MSATLNERNPQLAIIPLGSQASGMNVVVPGLYFRKHSRIKNVWLINGAAIAANGTNHVAVTLQDNSGTPVSYASADTSAAAVVANTQYALALTTPVGDTANQPEADVPAGTLLTAKAVGAGTAVLTNAVVMVEHYPL